MAITVTAAMVRDRTSSYITGVRAQGTGLAPVPAPSGAGGSITHGRQVNATNTGIAGIGVLRSSLISTGFTTYSTNGQTVTGRLFTNGLLITGDNVTIRGCQVEVSGSSADAITIEGDNATIESCTILAPTGSMYHGILANWQGTGATIDRCDISLCENNVTVNRDNCTITQCYLHDVSNASNPSGHRDVIELYGGTNAVVQKSRLVMNADETAVINAAPWSGSDSLNNATIQDNYIDGGHMHFVVDLQSTGTINNFKVLRNDMGGHTTPGVIGRYAALNNVDGRAIVTTPAAQASTPSAILWPNAAPDANYWVDCSDLSPDRTGQIVAP